MTREDIDSVRSRSRAGQSGPWVTDYNEMAKKTVFRRLTKWIPLSAEIRDAYERDADSFEPIANDSMKRITLERVELPEVVS